MDHALGLSPGRATPGGSTPDPGQRPELRPELFRGLHPALLPGRGELRGH